ncbi:MAG: MBL fold metallo-hydrolase [Spirochaetales bacterium]|nr:MBL fold metallo-hydrolase [Spirochaetales bacterium]
MKISKLTGGPLAVNTWFVFNTDGSAMVIDPGVSADSIIAHLKQNAIEALSIVLTHGHLDHITAIAELTSQYPSAKVYCHRDDAFFLGEGAVERHRSFFEQIGADFVSRFIPEHIPQADEFLEEGQTLGEFTILHTPGHSPGSVCLYAPSEQVLFSGDTLFNAGWGRTDSPGGSDAALFESLTRLSKLPGQTRVLCGHGEDTTIAREFLLRGGQSL